jgi:membrane peptidoglycan carboxypeptidase
MAKDIGLNEVVKIAEGAGINKKDLDNAVKAHAFGMSIGAGLVTPVEQAAGYGMFANGGKHYDAHVVISVKTTKGVTVMNESAQPKDVISPDTAADATYAMQQVVKYGTARGLSLPGRPIAGKTGTNNENKEAWFVGYTPQLSAAVGMYKEVPQIDPKTKKVMKDANGYPLPKEVSLGNIQGADTPTRIWRDFMTIAMANRPVEQFPTPAFGGQEHDLVQKPAPKPSPDPFNNNNGDVTNDPACAADPTCGNPNGNGFNGNGNPGTGTSPPSNGTFTENGGLNGNPASATAKPAGGG